ncbi:MAG: DUF4404 family protein [Moraxellaceae bacterium]|nr:DUF4404 family protein [Moraxellaceae bacterium]
MPRKITEDKLNALKAHLHQEQHHLDAGQRDLLHAEVTGLEQRLAELQPLDTEALQDQLWQWEARVEAEHPLLASVVRDVLQKLSAMGI